MQHLRNDYESASKPVFSLPEINTAVMTASCSVNEEEDVGKADQSASLTKVFEI
jgi:hypothetical protein